MSETITVAPSDLAGSGGSDTQNTRRQRVLIAESDGFTRMVLMLLFRMTGFGVDFTANGLIALGKLRSRRPDALLLELQLSGLSGLELMRWVRSDPQFRDLRIYVFTDAEAMKRGARKEVVMSATRVFDKRAISREDVVRNIIADLSPRGTGIRQQPQPSANRRIEASEGMLLPGEFDQLIEGVRAQSELVSRGNNPEERTEGCRELLSRVSSLRSCADVGGLKNLERQAKVLEAFLKQLCRERKACTDRRVTVLRRAVEILAVLSRQKRENLAKFSAVLVDEFGPSSQCLSNALAEVGVQASSFDDASHAVEHLGTNQSDLIVVNVCLPELHGLELADIRRLPGHADTPVIFASECTASDRPKEAPLASAPLVNKNPLLLHEIVLLALNQLQSRPDAYQPADLDLDHLPEAAIERGQSSAAPKPAATGAQAFASLFTTLRPGTPEPGTPVELSALAAEAPASAVPVTQPVAEADIFIPENFVENGEENTTFFAQEDQAQAPDIVAQDNLDAPAIVPTSESCEELNLEQSSLTMETQVSSEEFPSGLDPEFIVVEQSASPPEAAAEPAQSFEPARALEPNPDDQAEALEECAMSTPALEGTQDALQVLERERDELREAVAQHQGEREELVNRIVNAENNFDSAHAELQQQEETISNLQKELDELKARQASAADQTARIAQLENELKERSAEQEADRAKAEEQSKQFEAAQARLRQEREALEAEAKRAVASYQELQRRCGELEQQLAHLKKEAAEWADKLAQESDARSKAEQRLQLVEKDLKERAVELERVAAEAKQREMQYEQLNADRQRELETAKEALARTAEGREQLETRCAQLEQQTRDSRQTEEELNCRLASREQAAAVAEERVAELEREISRLTAEFERTVSEARERSTEHERIQSDLRQQLQVADAAARQAEGERQQAQLRCLQVEQEAAALRQAGDQLSSKLANEQQSSAVAEQRAKELESILNACTAELEQARTEADREAQDHQRSEDYLRQELEAAVRARTEQEAAGKRAQARLAEVEAEMAAFGQERDTLKAAASKESEAAGELRALNRDLEKQLQTEKAAREAQIADLEQRIGAGVAALARATADLAKETGERQRSEERAVALNRQLQELHAESGRFLEVQRADQQRLANLEAQLRQRDETLAKCVSDLQQQKSEARLLREQLQKSRELNAHFRKNVSVFREAHRNINSTQQGLQAQLEGALETVQKSEARLERATAEGNRLAAELEGAQRDLQGERRKRENVEAELQRSLETLRDRALKAEQNKAERQRLIQALDSARASHRDRAERAALELSKVQAALQFEQLERKRREAQLARMRLVGLEAARRARLLRNTLQKQTREPLDHLYQSARNLLQLELGEDQKKVAEAMLQDALLVRTRLQEPASSQGSSEEVRAAFEPLPGDTTPGPLGAEAQLDSSAQIGAADNSEKDVEKQDEA